MTTSEFIEQVICAAKRDHDALPSAPNVIPFARAA